MIGRGFHSFFHGGFHHAGPYGGFGSLWLTIGIIAAVALVAAVAWALGLGGKKSYARELDRKRQELGLPPDGDQPPIS